jgi:hypothetical protein
MLEAAKKPLPFKMAALPWSCQHRASSGTPR